MNTKTRKPISTSTKAAARVFERHAAEVLKHTAAYLTDDAKDGKHGPRWIKTRMDAAAAGLDLIRNAPEVVSISIGVEWAKSATWGRNPTASACVETSDGRFTRYEGRASGCGYDKESAAIAEALNQSPAVKRLLIVAAARGGFPYGGTVGKYGASLSGGVGVSCFRSIFEFCGYKWDNTGSGRTFDAYHITR
jgi:hypothetical protein